MIITKKQKISKGFLFLTLLPVLCLVSALSGCGKGGAGSGDIFDDSVRYTATAVESGGKNYRIDYSYQDGAIDYWFIYLGRVEFVPISAEGTKYYNGITPISLTYTTEKITEGHVEEKNEYCIQNSTKTAVSDQHEASLSFKADVTAGGFNFGYDIGYKYLNNHREELSVSNSVTDSYTTLKGWQETHTETVSYTLGENGEKAGFYRYALFVTCDVYIAIARDRLSGMWNYEYSGFARPGSFFTAIDYSENNEFKSKEDAVKLKFDSAILDALNV